MERRYKHSELSIASVAQIALLGLLLAFTFATPLLSPARAAVTHEVSIVDFQFNQATITIAPGDSVKWTNDGPSPHSSTSDTGSAQAWDSGVLSVGGTYTVLFSNAGSFSYHCSVHPFMTGTVIVGAIPEFSNVAFVMIGLMVLVLGISVVLRKR